MREVAARSVLPTTTVRYRSERLLHSATITEFPSGGVYLGATAVSTPISVAPQPVYDPATVLCWAEEAYSAARRSKRRCEEACVDEYYRAAALAWYAATHCPQHGGTAERGWEIYHDGVRGLIETAPEYGRWERCVGLRVRIPGGWLTVGAEYHGFAWNPDDFDVLLPVDTYNAKKLRQVHCRSGLGLPLIVIRYRRPCEPARTHYLADTTGFAATAVLVPDATPFLPAPRCGPRIASRGKAVLRFIEPQSVCETEICGVHWNVAADLSAPLAFMASNPQLDRIAVLGLLRPETQVAGAGLRSLEPVQAGKIPLIFVHGLASEPSTWLGLANELRADPHFADRYQIWAFRYPTGRPFLRSAADLRKALYDILQRIDPCARDAALRQMVIVGHSMGGLIAKLQASHSSDILWRNTAYVPLAQICADAQTKQELAEMFFFEPHPAVKRVVYVATPHRGSPWARRPVGLLASAMVRRSPGNEERFDRVVDANPGAFLPYAERRVPTSIDILQPGHPLLEAIEKLPMDPCVKTHSIIGCGRWMWWVGDSDGAVPVESAVQAGVCSERRVRSHHIRIQSDPATVEEMYCILGLGCGR